MTNDMQLADLPLPITTYFERSQGNQRKTAIEAFASDAVVVDEGRQYRGTSEIAGWLDRGAAEYEWTTTFLRAERDDDTTLVVNRLEGTFPGGIVDLTFRFVLDSQNTAISELTIAP
ncbi:hypothetical protein ACFC25_18135 [Pseudarthrobacter sp. NPDC055928]|uniref:hypothetical protein n=1 Tax=Pseudarthrobacter sp. NPDC055928 TaxID=3345661 RepID=UPI0035DBB50C